LRCFQNTDLILEGYQSNSNIELRRPSAPQWPLMPQTFLVIPSLQVFKWIEARPEAPFCNQEEWVQQA
jgi:hypothetical protein